MKHLSPAYQDSFKIHVKLRFHANFQLFSTVIQLCVVFICMIISLKAPLHAVLISLVKGQIWKRKRIVSYRASALYGVLQRSSSLSDGEVICDSIPYRSLIAKLQRDWSMYLFYSSCEFIVHLSFPTRCEAISVHTTSASITHTHNIYHISIQNRIQAYQWRMY